MSSNKESKRGGTRPGAGRPAEITDARRVNVMLDPATIERAKEIGAGKNVSAGIRTAVAAYDAHANAELDRIRVLLEFISTADAGGEIYPSGPMSTEYSSDGTTIVRHIPPWRFLHGRGQTFIEAVEDAMKE